MYDHHIEEMSVALVEAGVVNSDLSDKAISVLRSVWENKIAIVWSADDVIAQAKQNGATVDEDQACGILNDILNNHDCTLGVTWETIKCHTEGL